MKNNETKLARIEKEIETLRPFAQKASDLGIDIHAANLTGTEQQTADRAKRFCELWQQWEALAS